ncbi:VWA domain-containing protein [Salinibacterium sp. G-O1]|uniref:vWA domain-containing protein n=1 Tax=Salinibacterium sp. G-O1 TaxID=3046208 RepID=UPI0024B9FD49|nr:VWA domain-containing protein [Salinibacterium sp. G-O1]MDJ0334725.1 VWA domain-containing protein [Salinibacterium sp. G-O1]
MALIAWWAPLVWLGATAVVIAAVVWYRGRHRSSTAAGIPVAHRERLTALPAYRRALARYRLLVAGFVVCLVAMIAAAAMLTARPAAVALVTPDLNNRDIVLCLDVSGSMVDYDAAVLEVFQQLSVEFTGERISLVVFNASAVTYFPLTADYDYISGQLARLTAEFDDPDAPYYGGTLIGNGSSLVGDGLASCIVRFDHADSDRSRSVILVTDNFVAGEQIFTLPDAAKLAVERGVRVYGINPGDATAKDYLDDLAVEFETAVVDSGGAYYALDDPGVIPSVVDRITSEQASVLPGIQQVQISERPQPWIWLAFASLVGLGLFGWRLKR